MSPFLRPVLSFEQLLERAEEFLDDYHAERILPVPIEEIVEFDFELQLVPVPGIKDDLGVDAFLTADLESIFVDEYVLQFVPTRFRFSLAHELAHYWLHQGIYSGAKINSVREYRRFQEDIGADDYWWLEWQANTFAGLVLVPRANLRHEFDQALSRAHKFGLTRNQVERHPARHRLTQHIADTFIVSADVASIRLEKDGLLPPLIPRRLDGE